jgi:hypothetical protein
MAKIETKDKPLPCPRCGSKMLVHDVDGNTRSWPAVSLACANNDCLWNMYVVYDERQTEPKELAEKMVWHWNEGILKVNFTAGMRRKDDEGDSGDEVRREGDQREASVRDSQ